MQLSKHFSLEELTLCSTATSLNMENIPIPDHLANLQNLAKCMEDVQTLFNRKIQIVSAYRSPQVAAAVGGVPNSAHALGHAVDFHVDGFSDLAAAKIIRDSEVKFDQLILEKGRYVHISFHPDRRGQVLRQPGGPGSPVFSGLEP